uniref:Uncharacterized protein n=1 Tax=Clastoptera arizonana TaxID=38151 RepID=A0A1B6DLU1_9HEMI
MDKAHDHYVMDYSHHEEKVLDLSQGKLTKQKLELKYELEGMKPKQEGKTNLKSENKPFFSHTYYPAAPLPLHYAPPLVMGLSTVTDSSDDASDMSSVSPPATASNLISSTFMMANSVINSTRGGKPTRPFKAYPKDLLCGRSPSDVLLGSYTNDEYLEFRKKMLSQIQSVSNKSNINMKRSSSPQQPSSTGEDDVRTAAYWERRRKKQ